MALSTLKRLGKLPFFVAALIATPSALAGTLTNVSVVPDDASPGATTNYTFTYTLEQDVNADEALFYVTFPEGAGKFSVATGACDRIASITLNPVPMGGAAICRASYGSGNTVGLAVNTSIGGGVSVPGGTEVEIVVSGVTNPSAAGNYNFDHGDGTGIITTQMMDPMFPGVTAKDIAGQQTVTIGSGSAVNGACGTSVGGVFTSAPAVSLCATGTATAVTTNPTTYTWGCNGTGGGTSTAANACSADLGYDLILSVSPPSGGSVSCGSNPVRHGDNRTCTPTASAGYTFVNWTGDCTGASCVLNNVTSALNPQANFALITHSITTTVVPASAGSISCTNNPVDDGDDSTCTYTANAGYTFANWSGDCTGATCALTGVTANKSVTANFTAPTFTVTVNTSGSGTASCTPNPVSGGSNATCTASPSAGNSFTGWSGDCTGGSCVLASVNANKTVTANFATSTYSISGSAAPVAGGSVSCSGSVSHGSNGSCTATANAGYTFTNWSGCPSANSCSFTNVTSSQSVTANFTINSYTVSATANPIDAGSASCTSPVAHGGTSSCTAKAAAGYKLTGWSGACSGSSCSIVNVTANASVTASFALLPIYNISTSVSPADSGKITCTKDIMEGGTGTCTAKASAGYRLKAWGGDCSGTSESCTLTNVTSAKSVSATFEEANTFTISARMESLTGYSSALHPKSNVGGVFGASINCSIANPVTINSTVTCSVDEGYELLDVGRYRGWSGGCSRVEGRNCIIENITTDKQITALYGINETSSNAINVHPAGAGSVWCGATLSVVGLNADYVGKNCVAEATLGYTFTGFSNTQSYAVNANFTKQTGTPSVVCSNCNTSTLTTDDSTIKSVTKTSEPDAQGNSTQSTVASTTNTETGSTSVNVTVNNQNITTGTSTPSNQLVVNVNDSTVTMNNDGSTSVVVGGSNQSTVTLGLSSGGLGGVIQGGSGSAPSSINAQSTLGIQTDVYNFEFTNGADTDLVFSKPVSIKLPIPDTTDVDTDLLTLAKIINGKLEYYGGSYNAEGKYFEANRKSFKPRAKSANDDYAYVSASWSDNVATDLVMRGTNDNTQIRHTATLDATTAVSIQTVTTFATGDVKTTLNLGSVDNTKSVAGNLAAGFATINVSGAMGTYKITDKQQPENDTRLVSLAVSNGELTSVEVSNGGSSQALYSAASGGPSLTGLESTAESISITLSYPAKN